MKIAFTGDWHYGCTTHSSVDTATNLPTRLIDFELVITELFRRCVELGVKRLVIMGDLYHVSNPLSTYIARSIALFRRLLAEYGIEVYAYDGNHDWSGKVGRKNATASLVEALRGVPNFHWWDEATFIKDWTPEIDGLLVVPHGSRVHGGIPEMPDHNGVNLVFAHTTIQGATSGAEETLLADKVRELGGIRGRVDAYFTGHIHKPQTFRYGEATVVYPGSIERIDFGERKEEKGFVLVDTEKMFQGEIEPALTWVPLTTRPMVQMEFDLDDPDRAGFKDWGPGLVTNALVKVVVRGKEANLHRFNGAEVRKSLLDAGANYVAGFTMDIQRERVVKDPVMTERLTLDAALSRYVERAAPKDDPKFIEAVTAHGNRILLEASRAR